MHITRFFRLLWIAALLSAGSAQVKGQGVYRFDFGPAGSRAAEGFTAVTPATAYQASRGYGFMEAPVEAEVIDGSHTAVDAMGVQLWRIRDGFFGLDPLTEDYVAGPRFDFRVDLPNGRYGGVLTLGNKNGIHHLVVRANGREVARDLSVFTYHYAGRGNRDDTSIGAAYRLPFEVEVSSGSLRLEFTGDSTLGKNVTVLTRPDGRTMEVETGAPYRVNSVMALTLFPHRPRPLRFSQGRLEVDPGAAAELVQAVQAFNAGNLAGVRERLEGWNGDPWAEVQLWMALAGHPDADDRREAEAIARAQSAVSEIARQEPGNQAALELQAEVRQFMEAVRLFNTRDTGNTEIGMIGSMHQSHALWRQFGTDHPFHYKGLIYSTRMFKGMVPFTFTPKSEEGMALMREVEKRFPHNKYVRLYLHGEWKIGDWKFDPYQAPVGVPAWAAVLRRAYRLGVDLAEWWADHRQLPNGSLGGGWNDDVELMPIFALTWMVSPDSSPKIGTMFRRMTEGIWASDNLDRRYGFSASFFDAEHAAEDQGNSLPYLIGLEYGNPRYFDWNLRTAQFFRNFLTVEHDGHRHFRSGNFDATRYSQDLSPQAQSDSVEAAICFRAFPTIPWLIWYNQNPAARQMLLEHADAWLAASLDGSKGKPAGIIPSQLGLNDQVGGPSEHWRGRRGLGGGGDWPQYTSYLYYLLLNAYRQSGDEKYLQPFYLTLEFMRQFRDSEGRYRPLPQAAEGSPQWIYNRLLSQAHVGESFWILRRLTGDKRFDDFILQTGTPYIRFRLTGDRDALVQDIEGINANFRRRWPHMTAEGVMTDRVGYLPQMVSYMIGWPVLANFQGFPNTAATYVNTGGDFAALVEEASQDRLRIAYYSFDGRPRSVGVRPWLLKPGDRYRLRLVGSPENRTILEERSFVLAERGEPQRVAVPPGQEVQILLEREETGPGASATLPDPAVLESSVHWNPRTDQIEATISNIGSAPARNVEVAFYHLAGPGDLRLLEKAVITRLGAPLDLNMEQVTVGTWNHRDLLTEGDDVVVMLDPDGRLQEITRTNNRATYRLTLSAEDRERMRVQRLTNRDRRNYQRSPSLDSRRQGPEVHYLPGVVYGNDDPQAQRLDAWLVQSEQPTPVVIEFHGGGWRRGRRGDLEQYGGFLRSLIREGYSLISADYRLTPRFTYPAQVEDAARVVQFVRSRAAEWNIDPERIALVGGSAGAHLALWVGLHPDLADSGSADPVRRHSTRVSAVIDLWGPSDLREISPRVSRGEALSAFLDTDAGSYEKPDADLQRRLKEASPVSWVSADDPPVFIVHNGPAGVESASDPRVSGANRDVHSAAFGLILREALRRAGVDHELVVAPDASRTFQSRALEFLRRQLSR